jgi:protein piccolo
MRENDYVGDIQLQIGHNSEREQLVVRIIQAKNLPAKDTNGYSDPFVKVYLLPGREYVDLIEENSNRRFFFFSQENKRRTKHISKNLNPSWDHTVIYGNMHREELQYKMLEFTVWDYDRFKANDFIGQITIDLKGMGIENEMNF